MQFRLLLYDFLHPIPPRSLQPSYSEIYKKYSYIKNELQLLTLYFVINLISVATIARVHLQLIIPGQFKGSMVYVLGRQNNITSVTVVLAYRHLHGLFASLLLI